MNETYKMLILSTKVPYACHSRRQAKEQIGRQHDLYPCSSRNAALLPAQIPLTGHSSTINGDADILNGLEGKTDWSHATARPS
jgi:hypothetical protein